jgi:hypothetical protein
LFLIKILPKFDGILLWTRREVGLVMDFGLPDRFSEIQWDFLEELLI